MENKKIKIGDICHIEKGITGIKKAIPGSYPMVALSEERKTHNQYQFDTKAVIIPLVSSTGHGHASMKRIHYQEGKFALGTILCAIIPNDSDTIDALFLYHYLNTFKEQLFVPLMKGMANVTLSMGKIKDVEIPLPPIGIQLAWIRRFENASNANKKIFNEIKRQQSLLSKLKQFILQDAISGKLTEQWRKENPDVEPASEMLKRIKTEKERLVKEKKIKKEKPLPPISEAEIPFELPEGWVWCRLGEIGNAISFPFIDGPFGSSINTKADYIEDGIPVLRMMNVKPFNFINSPIKFISFNKFESLKKHNVLPGDILFSKVGAGIGEACIVPNGFGPGLLSTTGITRIRVGQIVDNNYLCHFLNGNINEFKSIARQTSQPFLNMTMIKTFLFPLPPYLDQLEIIRKTTELIKICNHIENQNLNNFKNIQMLMQMVLKEAFEEK
jgi:type I restriction enzyme S subunit